MKAIVLKTIDSTNSYAFDNARTIGENAYIIAETQTRGRGQFDRIWFSETEKSITLSFLLFKEYRSKELVANFEKMIPAIIRRSIDDSFNVSTNIIPPNDIYLNEKKVCGILVETNFLGGELEYVVVGIGLNLNNEGFPTDIQGKATSIFMETGRSYSSDGFIDNLVTSFTEKIYV